MTRGHLLGLALMSTMVLAVLAAPAAAVQHYYVDDEGDNSNSGASADDPWRTIKYALANTAGTAANPVTIHVAEGVYDRDLGESFPIKPKNYDSIVGAGSENSIIYGDNAHSVFHFENVGAQTKIEALTITHGRNAYGGGIYCDAASPTIEDCAIDGNSANYGGGIWAEGGSSAKMLKCTVSNNDADYFCGGILCYGSSGAIGTDMLIEDCTIENNRGGTWGGGLYCLHHASPTIKGCSIVNNKSGNSGAGLACEDYSSPIVSDTKIIGNELTGSTDVNGAGVRLMYDCAPLIQDCIVEGNSGAHLGGGIAIYRSCSPTILRTIIRGNVADEAAGSYASGGGIACFGDSTSVIEDCTIEGNRATEGGGIRTWSGSSITMRDCVVADNEAEEDGGGIVIRYANPSIIQDCTIENNRALTGGGMHVLNSEVEIYDCQITGNACETEGGGICALGNSELHLEDCLLEGNQSRQGAGASLACRATFTDCVMRDNAALKLGGAIYCSGASGPIPEFTGCVFEDNSAEDGGALCVHGNCEPIITDCTIERNEAADTGGGIFCAGYEGEIGPDMRIEHCIINDNRAAAYGGAVYCHQYSSPTLFNCLFFGNSAACGHGAGLWCSLSSSPNILNCTVANHAGDGVYVYGDDGSEPTLANCILWGNEDDLVGVDCSNVSHCDIQDGDCAGSNSNFSQNPLFVGGYYLSQMAAGQGADSPCVDAGDDTAAACGLDEYTTRTDGGYDEGTVDVGYHYQEGSEYENRFPTLTGGDVSPDSGTILTLFTYSVHYKDPDGDDPSVRLVFVDGGPGREMSLQNGDPANGTYEHQTTLAEGDHFYYFYFEDGNGGWARDPETGCYEGPSVHPDPVLEDGDVDPDYGTTGTIFTYSVRYRGNGDGLPTSKKVYMDGSGHDMTRAAGGPENQIYTYKTTLGLGEHEFYFLFINANGSEARDPGSGSYSGPTVLNDLTRPCSSCVGPEWANDYHVELEYTAYDEGSGVARVDLYASHDSGDYQYTGLSSETPEGKFSIILDAGDGEYEFYTIARDLVGNREVPPASPDTAVLVDVTMPVSHCWTADLSNTLPIPVEFEASDSGSGIAYTRLWYRFAGTSQWTDSWQEQPGETGVFMFDPCEVTPEYGDGAYELITVAVDSLGNPEAPPAMPDDSVLLDRMAPESSLSCVQRTREAAISLDYTSSDGLTGVARVELWYRCGETAWKESGLSSTNGQGAFEFAFHDGNGIYEYLSVATDVAGNTEPLAQPNAVCAYDTTPPVSTARTQNAANQPEVSVDYASVDTTTEVESVHLYYRYASFDGSVDDTLVDTGLDSSEATGTFDCTVQSVPGFYQFYVVGTDVLANVESADSEPDAICMFDPALALSEMEAPLWTTQATVSINFSTSIAADSLDFVALCYRYGAVLAEAEAAPWVTTSTVSFESSGTLEFVCEDGDGYYLFMTRARSAGGLWEPIADTPDATTILDTEPPQTELVVPNLTSETTIGIAFSSVESYGLRSIDIYVWCEDTWSLFTTVSEPEGSVEYDTQGVEGEYRFYSVGADLAGNVEQVLPEERQRSVQFDLLPPTSRASSSPYGAGFPILIGFEASDTVTQVTSVSLWVRYESGEWQDTGLVSGEPAGVFEYTPSQPLEGTYCFYTSAVDELDHVEEAPLRADARTVVDWTAPVSSCASPAFSSNAKIALDCTADDAVSGMQSLSIWFRVGDAPWEDSGLFAPAEGGIAEVDLSVWGEGTFGFCTRGADKAGNLEALSDEPQTSTLYDASAPQSAALLPVEGVITSETPIDIPYSASDAGSGIESVELLFSFMGGVWQETGLGSDSPAGSFSFTPPHGDGRYEFATVSADKAGNSEALPGSPDGGALVFDRTSPTSSVSSDGSYARQLPIVVSFTAEDQTSGVANVSLFVSKDGAGFFDTGLFSSALLGSFAFTPSDAAEGTYRFYTVATDGAGNVEPPDAESSLTVVFDAGAPSSEASIPMEFTNSFPIQVSYSAIDPVSGLAEVQLWVSVNGSDYAPTGPSTSAGSGVFGYTPRELRDGKYEFYTVAKDLAGNSETPPDEADASIIVDRIRPSSSCSVGEALASSFPITVEYASSDEDSGIDHVELFCRRNGGAWTAAASLPVGSGSCEFTPSTPRDGYYEFHTKAYDRASNAEDLTGPDAAITVDTTAPVSSASAPGETDRLPLNISFMASDDGSGVSSTALWYRHNDGPWTESQHAKPGTSGSFDFEAPEGVGTYRFYTICCDRAGNVEAAPASADAKCAFSQPSPAVWVSTTQLDFGSVNVCSEVARRLKIVNRGDADLTISRISTADPSFRAELDGSLPAILSPQDEVELEAVFSPDEERVYEGELLIESNDPNQPSLSVSLLGEGQVGGLTLNVWANQNDYVFGDLLELSLSCQNSAEAADVDLYLVLTFDLGGPEERSWSATASDEWVEGVSPMFAGFEIPYGLDLTTTWWESRLPCPVPMISRSGAYTIRMAAADTGTFDLVSNLAQCAFSLTGSPFVCAAAKSSSYWIVGDVAEISLDVSLPDYALLSDLMVIVQTPNGTLFSPFGLGTGAMWVAGLSPVLTGVRTAPGFRLNAVFWEQELPGDSPFDTAGNFRLFAALVEPGTLVPLSDIGTTSFTLR